MLLCIPYLLTILTIWDYAYQPSLPSLPSLPSPPPDRAKSCFKLLMPYLLTYYTILTYLTYGICTMHVLHTQIDAYLELSGTIWSYLELSGAIWSYLELSGIIWSFLKLSGAIWGKFLFYGIMLHTIQ